MSDWRLFIFEQHEPVYVIHLCLSPCGAEVSECGLMLFCRWLSIVKTPFATSTVALIFYLISPQTALTSDRAVEVIASELLHPVNNAEAAPLAWALVDAIDLRQELRFDVYLCMLERLAFCSLVAFLTTYRRCYLQRACGDWLQAGLLTKALVGAITKRVCRDNHVSHTPFCV